ncbi:MAG TPA: dicarboxylate/amino acid:cation symporter [Pirellulaceae bacterium]|nr:dicarboxylate/amino acid:cation symporter [Pirellulaceae bacterium]
MSEKKLPRAAWWAIWRWKLHWQVLFGLLIGAWLGWLLAVFAMWRATPETSAQAILSNQFLKMLFDTGGAMFLNALKVIVIPLVTSSIVLSVATIGARHGFARLGVKTLLFFLGTGLVATLLGLLLVNLVRPGVTPSGKPLLTPERAATLSDEFQQEVGGVKSGIQQDEARAGQSVISRVLKIFERLVPSNPVKAMVEMDLLGLIVLAILVGFFLSQLGGSVKATMELFWQGVYDISFGVTSLVLRLAPIGVGCLLASTISQNYVTLAGEARVGEFVVALRSFAIVAVGGLVLQTLVVLPAIMWMFGVNPILHLKAMMPALVTAFSTSSSNATLSVTLDCLEHRAGVSREISSFVAPLGATVNMNGTALYECVAAMFVVQLFGVQLGWVEQIMVVLIALLTSVGVAGVPSASLVAIVIILDSVTRQVQPGFELSQGLAILLILDRPLDMLRTAVNVFSDTCGAAVVARSEGESLYRGDR